MGVDGTAEFLYAVKLLARRDLSVAELREKLAKRFGAAPQDVIETLLAKKFLNDRRFAENFVSRRKTKGRDRLRLELAARGVDSEVIDAVLSTVEWPSIREALKAKMSDWNLRAPLQSHDAARLFRALARLGYEEDAIREEIQLEQ